MGAVKLRQRRHFQCATTTKLYRFLTSIIFHTFLRRRRWNSWISIHPTSFCVPACLVVHCYRHPSSYIQNAIRFLILHNPRWCSYVIPLSPLGRFKERTTEDKGYLSCGSDAWNSDLRMVFKTCIKNWLKSELFLDGVGIRSTNNVSNKQIGFLTTLPMQLHTM